MPVPKNDKAAWEVRKNRQAKEVYRLLKAGIAERDIIASGKYLKSAIDKASNKFFRLVTLRGAEPKRCKCGALATSLNHEGYCLGCQVRSYAESTKGMRC